MDGASFSEVGSWATALAGLATLIIGWPTGPAGWVVIVGAYSGAFLEFYSLTSAMYATVSRMDLSQTAAQYEENARNMNFNGGAYWENTSFSSVIGY